MSRRFIIVAVIAGIVAAAIGTVWHFIPGSRQLKFSDRPYQPPAMAFDGDTRDLKSTVVVPTLDSELPEGKNVIWCASFQAAWDHFKDDVAGEPIRVEHAEALAAKLNNGAVSAGTLPEGSYYAAAGFVREGIIQKIRGEMQSRFHKEPMDLSDGSAAAVAYSYLQASVPFTIPYFENDKPFEFIDSLGRKTAVSSFGLRTKDLGDFRELHEQPQVLCASGTGRWYIPTEFAIDLCRDSKPNQVIVATVPRKATLQNILDDLDHRMTVPLPEITKAVGFGMLLVPNLNWSLSHRFSGLEGPDKVLLNAKLKGLYIGAAIEKIDFHLDRAGVELVSESGLTVKSAGAPYIFDHPFLIIVKKRGAKKPFFVMWVDNAELLSK